MRVPSITRLAHWAVSPVFSFLSNHPRHISKALNHCLVTAPRTRRRFTGLCALALPDTAAPQDGDAREGSTRPTTEADPSTKENPFYANKLESPPPEEPKIPPPHFFDDPVDLSVVVSWVEDAFSENWGTLEDIQPLFYEYGMGYTQVAICVSDVQKNIYVTFEGTNIWELPDVFSNVNILWDSFGPPALDPEIQIPGQVQRGWNRKVFNPELYKPLSEEVKMVKRLYPDYQVIVAGHSLGAALSILYGTYLAKYVLSDVPVQVINLGSPRVGDEEFYHAVRQIPNLTIWRMVFEKDIVARYPPMWMGYRHVGHLLHWDEHNDDRNSTNTKHTVDAKKVKAYHQQLESCTVPLSRSDGANNINNKQCYAGIDARDWNILFGKISDHEHKNYKCVIEEAKEHPKKYWPEGFELLIRNDNRKDR